MARVKNVAKEGSQEIAVMVYTDGNTVILLTTTQINLCCLISALLGASTKFTWIVVIKIFAVNLYHHSYFLAAQFDFTFFLKCDPILENQS